MTRTCAITLATVLAVLVISSPAKVLSAESELVSTPDGKPVFELLYDDEYGAWFPGEDKYSDLRNALINEAQYWAEAIAPGLSNSSAVPIGVLGTDQDGASAQSYYITDPGHSDYTQLGAALLRDWRTDPEFEGVIRIGTWPSYYGSSIDDPRYYDYSPATHLPQNGNKILLSTVMLHEIAHALGLGSSAFAGTAFADVVPLYDKYLYDANGNVAKPGQRISTTQEAGIFYLPADGKAFFKGPNVMEVLDGALPAGIPINGWEGMGASGQPLAELSHIELRNSLMSHQNYRNYGTFMEAELALMQDIGYTIDRSQYYGRSIYNDNLTINNTVGFNGSGTAGVGLHVYGTHNTITQSADLRSRGSGGIGIRVDGWDNALTIAPSVTVRANGDYGIGVALAYGKNHTVNHRGSIVANGSEGRGLSFDFPSG